MELHESRRDPLHGKAHAQKTAILDVTSYRDWLTKHWGLSDEAANTFQKTSQDFFALNIASLPASWALEYGMPGFLGIDLPVSEEAAAELNEPYIYHFPDGNASIARLLVRSLVPGVAPGRGMEDIVLAPFDYARLDTCGVARAPAPAQHGRARPQHGPRRRRGCRDLLRTGSAGCTAPARVTSCSPTTT